MQTGTGLKGLFTLALLLLSLGTSGLSSAGKTSTLKVDYPTSHIVYGTLPPFSISPSIVKTSMIASWYGRKGTKPRTSSGLKWEPEKMSAASRTLPFGTLVKLTYPKTGRTVVVMITDRGPMNPKWGLDLSEGAARFLGTKKAGVATLLVEILPSPVTCDKFFCFRHMDRVESVWLLERPVLREVPEAFNGV